MSIKSLPLSFVVCFCCFCCCIVLLYAKTLRYMHNKGHCQSIRKFSEWNLCIGVLSNLNLLYHSIVMGPHFIYSIRSNSISIAFHFILQFSFSCFFFNCYLFCTQIGWCTEHSFFCCHWNFPIKSTLYTLHLISFIKCLNSI